MTQVPKAPLRDAPVCPETKRWETRFRRLFQRHASATQASVRVDTAPERAAPVLRLSPERQRLLREAEAFLALFQREQGLEREAARYAEMRAEIEHTGTYWQTPEELAYGAQVAWRNSSRCIGRLQWAALEVRDQRHLTTAEEVFAALLEHLQVATNGGKIRSTISIFAPPAPGQPGMRIWNPQVIRYAGYRMPDGSILGDPLQVSLTEALHHLGWRKESPGAFDILPLVIQMPGEPPRLFEVPPSLMLEVPLSHPEYPWFAELGLKWHALPVISNMCLEIGGIRYTAAPFNGWYLSTEIGARNLGDVARYNLVPVIAHKMGLDTRHDRTLWRDRALVELNVAVLHSFTTHGVTLVDHHTASRQFICHQERERTAGRGVPADWGWIVPPISGSATPVFHIPLQDQRCTPNFFSQPDPWRVAQGTPFDRSILLA
ncbi:MAG TPA: nitric oxide synthase oxygenase [Ktedonobacterales bacterium]|nr:nitric oxide synthase oxygenase [Ktedonobacterales bacterium]